VADAEGHLISSTDVARLSQPLGHAHIDPGCSRIPTGCHGDFKRTGRASWPLASGI
jgi:hypothetical protein